MKYFNANTIVYSFIPIDLNILHNSASSLHQLGHIKLVELATCEHRIVPLRKLVIKEFSFDDL